MVKVMVKALVIVAGLLFVSELTFAQVAVKVRLLSEQEPVPQAAKRIKRITVGGDVSASYTYEDIIEKIEDIAEEWNAGIAKIETHEKGNERQADKLVVTLYSIEHNTPEGDFVWSKNRKLAWRDFQGQSPRLAQDDMTVAATYCGFGYDMSYKGSSKPTLSIKNRFYVDKSWGLENFMSQRILEHEQAHFDLCEIYTRKFRELAQKRIVAGANYKKVIESAYDQVYSEYEQQQQRYDSETEHGNNKEAQIKWLIYIEQELQKTDAWHEA